MKNARHAKILELVQAQAPDSQEELLRRLRAAGFGVTQATVSRDIRELHLVKAAVGDGRYRYMAPVPQDRPRDAAGRFATIFREAAVSIDSAVNIVVVKCFSGMANAACELFDSLEWEDVLGTLSGDGTFIVIAKTEAAAVSLCRRLRQYTAEVK